MRNLGGHLLFGAGAVQFPMIVNSTLRARTRPFFVTESHHEQFPLGPLRQFRTPLVWLLYTLGRWLIKTLLCTSVACWRQKSLPSSSNTSGYCKEQEAYIFCHMLVHLGAVISQILFLLFFPGGNLWLVAIIKFCHLLCLQLYVPWGSASSMLWNFRTGQRKAQFSISKATQKMWAEEKIKRLKLITIAAFACKREAVLHLRNICFMCTPCTPTSTWLATLSFGYRFPGCIYSKLLVLI